MFLIQAAIAVLLFITLPLWNKERGDSPGPEAVADIPLGQLVRTRGVKLMWGLFLTACAIESACGSFGGTYLVERRGLAAETAVGVIIFYYVGLALGRFTSGLVSAKLHSWTIVRIGQCILAAGVLALLLPGGIPLASVGLFMTGFGNGPLFPNFNYMTPLIFGTEASPAIIGSQMAVASVSSMLTPTLCGFLGQQFGMGIFPLYLLVCSAGMAVVSVMANRVFWPSKQ